MICHQRRRAFFIKSVLCIAVIWLVVMILLHISKMIFGNPKDDVPAVSYFDPYSNAKDIPIAGEKLGYAPLLIDVPHWRDMFQDISRLPGYGGPGEYGLPFVLGNLTREEETAKLLGWDVNAFNQFVSDRISFHRRLPDVRPEGCRNELYSRNLPRTSVIVCFHNEAFSVLMRTVHSILDRTPANLLEEIILVDDFSNLSHLRKDLEEAISPLVKVKLIRASKREGLIRARLMGAAMAKAPVLTFLDSHCECAPGWVEPLIQRIYDSSSAVVAPVIDIIDEDTFQYNFRETDDFGVGGFNWDLQFDWHMIPEGELNRRKHDWDPVRTPTVAGGLFSISKEFFEKIGKYDEGFDIWGGENLELSFKTWMCGGTLEIVPCSHVGHVFRKRSPYVWKPGENVFRTNCIRLAEVWLDDYKQLYYKRLGIDAYRIVQQKKYGDVSSRIELRKNLNCKSFEWYLKNIYPEQYVPEDLVAEGEIRNIGVGADTCLDSTAKGEDLGNPVGVWSCHLEGGNQYFMYTQLGEIRKDIACLDYAGEAIIMYLCHGSQGNQLWLYDPDTHLIKHGTTGRCLEMTPDKMNVTMKFCNGNPLQLWGMQNYDPSKLLV